MPTLADLADNAGKIQRRASSRPQKPWLLITAAAKEQRKTAGDNSGKIAKNSKKQRMRTTNRQHS